MHDEVTFLKDELHNKDDELQVQKEELRVQTEELEAQLEELRCTSGELEQANEELKVQIQERNHAEEAMRRSEEKYRELVENANSIILRWDMDGNFTFFNEFAERFFGFSQDEIIGKNIVGTIVPATDTAGQDMVSLVEDIKRYPERYKTNANENVRKNGERVWISWTNKAVLDDRGKMIGILAVGNDITFQKLAEEELRRSRDELDRRVRERTSELRKINKELEVRIRERNKAEEAVRLAFAYNRSLIEASPDPLVTIAPDGRIMDVNRATEAVTGISREKLIGTDFSDYFTDPDTAKKGYLLVFKEGSVSDYPLDIRHEDGHITPVLYNATLYRDESGDVVGVFAAARDITERKRAEEDLRKTEEFNRRIIASSVDCIKVLDLAGNLLSMSEGGQRLLEITDITRYLNRSWVDFWLEKDRPNVIGAIEAARAGDTGTFQAFCPTAEGTPKWWDVIITPIFGHDKKVEMLLAVSKDVTERKRIEEELLRAREGLEIAVQERTAELQMSNKELQATIEERKRAEEKIAYVASFPGLNPNPVIEIDDHGAVIYSNSSADRLFPDMGSMGARHPILEGIGYEMFGKDLNTPIVRDVNIYGTFYMQTIICVPESKAFRIYSIDITERRRAEEAHSRLASIVEASNDAIIGKTLDGIITSWNKGAEQIYGYKSDEVIGKQISILAPLDHPDEIPHILETIRHGEGIVYYDTIRVRKDGTLIDVSLTVSPIHDISGRIIGAATIARDITERKQAEANLREKTEELEVQAEELESQTDELRYKNEALGNQILERRRAEESLLGSEKHLAADLAALMRLQKVSMRSIREGDLDSLLVDIMDAAIAVAEADKGTLQLLKPGSDRLEIVAQRGFEKSYLDFFSSVSHGSAAACGMALGKGERVIVEDVAIEPDLYGHAGAGHTDGSGSAVRSVHPPDKPQGPGHRHINHALG